MTELSHLETVQRFILAEAKEYFCYNLSSRSVNVKVDAEIPISICFGQLRTSTRRNMRPITRKASFSTGCPNFPLDTNDPPVFSVIRLEVDS